MKNFNLMYWLIIIILSLLTALEPLSIDLYLPGFLLIADSLNSSSAAVQISLSTFLGGFALGQLLWGPLADKYGRKKPILVSLAIFIAASVACMYVKTIEQLWVIRFIQAIGGCGGVVISRAVVTDYYDKSSTLKIYSILALIMGIAPIIAPIIGNGILRIFTWKALFGTLAILGALMFLLTLFVLPETHRPTEKPTNSVMTDYLRILRVKKFVVYAFIAGIANGALMIYVGNGPFLIMEKGGLSNNIFSIVFATNALGLMIGSYITTHLQKYMKVSKLVKITLIYMLAASVVLFSLMYINANIYLILIALFFYVFPIGILFPTTTELAITPFSNNSGTASALFGSIQLLLSCICSVMANAISNNTITSVGLSFFLCSVVAFATVFVKIEPSLYRKQKKQKLCKSALDKF